MGLNTDRDAVATQLLYWVNFSPRLPSTASASTRRAHFQATTSEGAPAMTVLGEMYNGWGDASGTQKLCQATKRRRRRTTILCRDNANFNTQPEGTAPAADGLRRRGADSPPQRDGGRHDRPRVRPRTLQPARRRRHARLGHADRRHGRGLGRLHGDLDLQRPGDLRIQPPAGRTTSGFRRVRYDTSTLKYSNLCFTDLGKTNAGCEVHNDGEIWATALWNMRAKLITKLRLCHRQEPGRAARRRRHEGHSARTRRSSPAATRSSPPTRRTPHGANACLIWSVFAEHEMGTRRPSAPTRRSARRRRRSRRAATSVADAGGPYTTPEGTNVTLSAAASTAGELRRLADVRVGLQQRHRFRRRDRRVAVVYERGR